MEVQEIKSRPDLVLKKEPSIKFYEILLKEKSFIISESFLEYFHD